MTERASGEDKTRQDKTHGDGRTDMNRNKTSVLVVKQKSGKTEAPILSVDIGQNGRSGDQLLPFDSLVLPVS